VDGEIGGDRSQPTDPTLLRFVLDPYDGLAARPLRGRARIARQLVGGREVADSCPSTGGMPSPASAGTSTRTGLIRWKDAGAWFPAEGARLLALHVIRPSLARTTKVAGGRERCRSADLEPALRIRSAKRSATSARASCRRSKPAPFTTLAAGSVPSTDTTPVFDSRKCQFRTFPDWLFAQRRKGCRTADGTRTTSPWRAQRRGIRQPAWSGLSGAEHGAGFPLLRSARYRRCSCTARCDDYTQGFELVCALTCASPAAGAMRLEDQGIRPRTARLRRRDWPQPFRRWRACQTRRPATGAIPGQVDGSTLVQMSAAWRWRALRLLASRTQGVRLRDFEHDSCLRSRGRLCPPLRPHIVRARANSGCKFELEFKGVRSRSASERGRFLPPCISLAIADLGSGQRVRGSNQW